MVTEMKNSHYLEFDVISIYYQSYYPLQMKLLSHWGKCTLSSIRRNSANFLFVLRLSSENRRQSTLHQQETSALTVDFDKFSTRDRWALRDRKDISFATSTNVLLTYKRHAGDNITKVLRTVDHYIIHYLPLGK